MQAANLNLVQVKCHVEIWTCILGLAKPVGYALRGGGEKVYVCMLSLINTVLCPIKFNSNTIELTFHTSCYFI